MLVVLTSYHKQWKTEAKAKAEVGLNFSGPAPAETLNHVYDYPPINLLHLAHAKNRFRHQVVHFEKICLIDFPLKYHTTPNNPNTPIMPDRMPNVFAAPIPST